jgi:hypothetical protein
MAQGHTAKTDDILGKAYLGCQTNMLTDKKCMQGTPPLSRAKEAIANVDELFFVGLQEQWSLSMCLFNAKTTGKRFVTQEQLIKYHEPDSKTSSVYDVDGYPYDAADMMLYEYVVERFEKEKTKYGISREACSFDAHGEPFDIEA